MYCLRARVIYRSIYTLFYHLNSKNCQYLIAFSIEYIVLILNIECKYSIFSNVKKYRIWIKALIPSTNGLDDRSRLAPQSSLRLLHLHPRRFRWYISSSCVINFRRLLIFYGYSKEILSLLYTRTPSQICLKVN
jgi:hypothetical protein